MEDIKSIETRYDENVLLVGDFNINLFDDKMFCLDIGKIYDPVQKICRDDCLTWNDKIGCVPITEENREKKAA